MGVLTGVKRPFSGILALSPHLEPVHVLPVRDVVYGSVFNVFKSAIAYDTSIKTLANMAKEGGEEQMVEYEFEPDTKEEVMQV